MDGDGVERLHAELSQLKQRLAEAREFSYLNLLEDTHRKAVLLAAASNHEERVKEILLGFVRSATSGNEAVAAFVSNKALARQYHTLFDWEVRNANRFFKLFGPSFNDLMKTVVANDTAVADGVLAFLQIGNDRNRLVHGDYVSFVLEKTADEIIESYRVAEAFINSLRENLMSAALAGTEGQEGDGEE